MKTFGQIRSLTESTHDPIKRSEHEMKIDQDISELMDIDDSIRSSPEGERVSDTTPLVYNMQALIALKSYLLGKRHGDRYPQHAKKTAEYLNVLKKEMPHLVGSIKESHSPQEKKTY